MTNDHLTRKKSPFCLVLPLPFCTLSEENCKINLPLASDDKKHIYGTWFLKKQWISHGVEFGLMVTFRRYSRFSTIKVLESFTKKKKKKQVPRMNAPSPGDQSSRYQMKPRVSFHHPQHSNTISHLDFWSLPKLVWATHANYPWGLHSGLWPDCSQAQM